MMAGLPCVPQRAGQGMLAVAVDVFVEGRGKAIGGIESTAFAHAAGKCVISAVLGAGKTQCRLEGVIAAYTDVRPSTERSVLLALFGNDVDDTAYGARAVQAAGGAAHDLDTLDHCGIDRIPIDNARGDAIDTHAIDQDQRLVGIGTAQEHACDGLWAAAVIHLHAALAGQYLGNTVL